MLDLGIAVESQIAERAEVAVAARDRQVEIDPRALAGAAERGLIADPEPGPFAVLLLGRKSQGHGRAGVPGGQIEQLAVGVGGQVAGDAIFARAVERIGLVALGSGGVMLEVGIAGDVPMPLALVAI